MWGGGRSGGEGGDTNKSELRLAQLSGGVKFMGVGSEAALFFLSPERSCPPSLPPGFAKPSWPYGQDRLFYGPGAIIFLHIYIKKKLNNRPWAKPERGN